jgi:hypothetical protein
MNKSGFIHTFPSGRLTVPKMVQKWVPKIATPTKSVDPK